MSQSKKLHFFFGNVLSSKNKLERLTGARAFDIQTRNRAYHSVTNKGWALLFFQHLHRTKNKLECLSVARFSEPSLIFDRQVSGASCGALVVTGRKK